MNPEKLYFKNNGYVIYRNVFNSDEILNFRHLVKSSLNKDLESNRASFSQEGKKKVYYTNGDMITKPISKLFFNNKIINIAKEVLK